MIACIGTVITRIMNETVLAGRQALARAVGGILAGALALAAGAAMAAAPVPARDARELVALINTFRAAPGTCKGRHASPAPPLAPQRVLAGVQVAPGGFLDQVLEQAGYPVSRAQVIEVSGPVDAVSVLSWIQDRYCSVLLSSDFSAIGVRHSGAEWQVVLAQPRMKTPLPEWPEAGRTILEAVNAARATERMCGARYFPAAGPVTWNDELAKAALAHSQDMALHHFFQHTGSDGSAVSDRATRAGYVWRRVGENIASGQASPDDAVAGWLDSPGHCANIMAPGFTEMGAAYFVNPDSKSGRVYWTQDFGSRP
jgi:uncharacterized protein YkwD